jgi:hypothetical protein
VFVSIGGADGQELATLLDKTTATVGILVEKSRELADVARSRTFSSGRRIEVFEGDADDQTALAVCRAMELVRGGVGRVRSSGHQA